MWGDNSEMQELSYEFEKKHVWPLSNSKYTGKIINYTIFMAYFFSLDFQAFWFCATL